MPRPVNVQLPKFKLETDYQMKDTLTTMGMARAFVDPSLPNGDGSFLTGKASV